MSTAINTIARQEEKGKIQYPVSIILNESGMNYFLMKNARVGRCFLANGASEPGFTLSDFYPVTLQRLLSRSYLASSESIIKDPVRQRRDIFDLTKLFVYGMLYRQFNTEVFEKIIDSDLVRRWNRENLKRPIDFKTVPNEAFLSQILLKNEDVVIEIKKKLLVSVREQIAKSDNLRITEKRVQHFLSENYIEKLDPLSIFLLTIYRDSQACRDLVQVIQNILHNYMEKAQIAEYTALMIIEVLNFITRIVQQRAGVVEEAQRITALTYKVNKKRPMLGDRAKLTIIVSSNRADIKYLNRHISEKTNLEIKEKSIRDYYYSNSDVSALEENLGLYYLSYLKEACKRMNIMFDSFVSQSRDKRQTLVHLQLIF